MIAEQKSSMLRKASKTEISHPKNNKNVKDQPSESRNEKSSSVNQAALNKRGSFTSDPHLAQVKLGKRFTSK